MNLKSLIPVSRERSAAHRNLFSFAALRSEIDRLFENLHGGVGFGSTDLVPNTDVAETVKASISKGVLKVIVPKATPAQVKKIEVKSAA